MIRKRAKYLVFCWCCLVIWIWLCVGTAGAAVTPDPQVRADLQALFDNPVQVGGFPYQDLFEAAAERYNLPLPFVLAVVRGESFFDAKAKSSKGALGLMQVMPATAADYGTKAAGLLDPATNIDVGVHYLADLYARLKDPYLTLGAYYCGCGGVNTNGPTIRQDCDEYVRYIHTHLTTILARAAGGVPVTSGEERYFTLTVFDNFLDGENFLAYLSEKLPMVQFDIFRREVEYDTHMRFQYQILATYRSEKEKKQVCENVKDVTGFSFCR